MDLGPERYGRPGFHGERDALLQCGAGPGGPQALTVCRHWESTVAAGVQWPFPSITSDAISTLRPSRGFLYCSVWLKFIPYDGRCEASQMHLLPTVLRDLPANWWRK